jgi:GrpB-like predicted nucleotidyltransferase (UPF0157 family)
MVEGSGQGREFKPVSDEELQKVTVGKLKPHNATIHLEEYDPRWPELFKREAKRIRSALGDKVLRLEHVGSTSVPGLCAKPVIDILLVVKDSSDESAYVPALEKAGYLLRIREPEWFEHRLFKGPDTDINLHVFSLGAEGLVAFPRSRPKEICPSQTETGKKEMAAYSKLCRRQIVHHPGNHGTGKCKYLIFCKGGGVDKKPPFRFGRRGGF